MQLNPFDFAATPFIHFGVGKRDILPGILASYGSRVLLISGGTSFDASPLCQVLWSKLEQEFVIFRERVNQEPTPKMVDDWVAKYRYESIDVVLVIGGGSAVDAGKVVAGLLPTGDSVMAYLEGVGRGEVFQGFTTPFVAVPTTAGTGGETSKNAVLSVVGENGFKKSFRHESLVAKHIILDPAFSVSCSASTTAACGMDAFTQLLESYVSPKASVMTDALAWSGLQSVSKGLMAAFNDGTDIEARAAMLYASSISGLTLANAGLGSVHGLASPLGAFFPIPHGVVCGTLLFEATRINIKAMLVRDVSNDALKKYASVGRLLMDDVSLDDNEAHQSLLGILEMWQLQLQMPCLSAYGIQADDFERIIASISSGSVATNPIALHHDELLALLSSRL